MDTREGAVFSHYRLTQRLGTGGMSEVWRAEDTKLGREIALKLLSDRVGADSSRRARLESEARAIAALNHPNIVTVHAIEEFRGRHFITMELVRGELLETLIPPGGYAVEEFCRLAIPICDAVSAAHEQGIIHRDLKPRNVMVGHDGTVKVLDFGLALMRDYPTETVMQQLTTESLDNPAGRISGTMHYMSPEQVQGKSLDPRADLFALGVMFYQMVTGRLPFRGETAPELIASILRDRPTPVTEIKPELPRHLDRLIQRCLEKDRNERMDTSRRLRNELDTLRRSGQRAGSGDRPSIAVLPFQDMSPEHDQEYFCDGIAEEIIGALARVRDLRVASRTSTSRFKGSGLDVREIGDRLGVAALLEGSIRKAGDRVRVTAQLIDVANGYEIWSEKYDRDLKDIFAIQDEIAQKIAEALKGTLSPYERRAIKSVATSDVQAFDYYLRGRSYYNQFRRRAIRFALQMFSRAIEIDSSYALAYAGTADCYSYLYLNCDRTEENRLQADQASRQALELDPELPEARVARGLALSISDRQEEAEKEFEIALQLNPRSFEAHYAYARKCFSQGQLDRAVKHFKEAAEIRPDDYQSPLLVAQIYDVQNLEQEAREARIHGVAMAEERLDLTPDDVRALYMGANGLVALGRRTEGLAWARRALEAEPDEPMLLYNLACIYALAEDHASALDCLERSVEGGFAHIKWMQKDSNLDSLRHIPRFQEILERVAK